MIFEIMNPSDKYTIEAKEFATACIACLAIGGSSYGLQEIGGEHEMPIFLFGGCDEWFLEKFELIPDDLFEQIPKIDLIMCLESIVIGDRDRYLLELGELEGDDAKMLWSEWHEKYRSSTNDIGGRAISLAQKLKKMNYLK